MKSVGKLGRILLIVQNLPVPFDRRVWLEATTLAKVGYKISVICPKGRGYEQSFENLEGIDIYRYALPFEASGVLGFFFEFVWCFLRTTMKSFQVAARGHGFDVIHACNPPETYWLLGQLWKLMGKKFVFDHHDLSPEMYGAKFDQKSDFLLWWLLLFERMTFKTAAIVITTNNSHKEIAISRGEKSPTDIFVVRSGPDLNRFSIFPPDPNWKLGKTYLLAYLGEICKQDGVDHLVRTIKIIRDDIGCADFHCVFIGGGPYQPKIKNYAEKIGVADLCTFTGRVSDEHLCRILSSADIGVDPDPKNEWSDQSTMNKIMEYMFFGLPIVAYDLQETKVSAGMAGVYATPNLEQSLAEKIVQLMDDKCKREAMSQYGFKKLREELAWEHSVPQLLAAYERVFSKWN
jgi:glycosyltransferase involved in cell wall biosynthesis